MEQLSKHQKQRIREHQQQKQEQHTPLQQKGRIIIRHGKSAEVTDALSQHYFCDIRQNLPPLVAGDEVIFETTAPSEGIIVALVPRVSVLSRTLPTGESRLMAANVTRVFVVVAPEPEVNELVLDRYLVGLAQANLEACIILNKSDLPSSKPLEKTLSVYQKIGYAVFETCSLTPSTLVDLTKALVDQTSIFIGQSGVGKSSLLQALLPNEELRTGALSEHSRLGTHTTSSTRLYTFPHGGYLLDSPGIRDFGINSISLRDLAQGFVEFRPYLSSCKFKNCEHTHEPYCAVQEAVAQGDISPKRLAHYQALHNDLQQMKKDYGKKNSD